MKLKKILSANFLANLVACFITINSYALTIISDLDDTIKHTNVSSKIDTVKNSLFVKTPFGGMAALYSELADDFHVVTGTPKLLRRKVIKFLDKAAFPKREIHMRDSLFDDIEKFKLSTLTTLLSTIEDEVILIGDDTEKDPDIYLEIQNQFPDKVVAIYIRRVKNKPLPSGVFGFYLPFEIALQEWHQGRLDPESLIELASDMHDDLSVLPHLFFPKHVFCPNRQELLQFDIANQSSVPRLDLFAREIAEETVYYCNRR